MNHPKQDYYHGTDENVLARVFMRLDLLDEAVQLPKPYRVASGMAGKSRVYFLFIPHGNSGLNVVAKFDEPHRAHREWENIEHLHRLNCLPVAMLPYKDNNESDGVIIYRAVEGATINGLCLDFRELLSRQMVTNPTNCIKALDMIFEALSFYYCSEPGAARMVAKGQMLSWNQVFPRLEDRYENLFQVAQNYSPGTNWDKDYITLDNLSGQRLLPNPIRYLPSRLAQMTGSVMLSRIHGDLNLTNALVAMDSTFAPCNIFIIDLANCESDRVTAFDFARFETELWHEAYPEIHAKTGHDHEPSALIQAFLDMRDSLEGRATNDLNLTAQSGILSFIQRHRRRATDVLAPQGANYTLYDYFHCLYFSQLASLNFDSVKEDPIKVGLALSGAALSLQTLMDIEAGRYSANAATPLFLYGSTRGETVNPR